MSLDYEGTVGAVCDCDGCTIFDLLPWHCGSCGGRFCSLHRLRSDHRCEEEAYESSTSIGKAIPTLVTPNKDGGNEKRFLVDDRILSICEVCGIEDCLLHKLVPDLAAKVEAERAAALKRRVGGKVGALDNEPGSTATTSGQPWRIGKLNSQRPSASPTPATLRNGLPITLVSVIEINENTTKQASYGLHFKKVLLSHGVSVGFAANAIASLVATEVVQLPAAQDSRPPTSKSVCSLYRLSGSSFSEIKGVEGGALYLIDHLRRDEATAGDASNYYYDNLVFAVILHSRECSPAEKKVRLLEMGCRFIASGSLSLPMSKSDDEPESESHSISFKVIPTSSGAQADKALRLWVAQMLISKKRSAKVSNSTPEYDSIENNESKSGCIENTVCEKGGHSEISAANTASSIRNGVSFYDDSLAPLFTPAVVTDLPVLAPRTKPINVTDPSVAKIGPAGKLVIGVQMIILTKDQKQRLGKTFCFTSDGKWSVGRLLEKILASAGSTSHAASWRMVLIDLSAVGLADSEAACLLKAVEPVLSVLCETVLPNGALMLLIEQATQANTDTKESASTVEVPTSLPTSLHANVITVGKVTKLSLKAEAKVRKDCVLQ